jgi:hypothetical protein
MPIDGKKGGQKCDGEETAGLDNCCNYCYKRCSFGLRDRHGRRFLDGKNLIRKAWNPT